MKALLWVGLVLLVLGVLSLFVPIPRKERAGIEAGGISVGVTPGQKEKVSPIISGVLILAGAGMMIAGRKRSD
jgi:hypothetical protein